MQSSLYVHYRNTMPPKGKFGLARRMPPKAKHTRSLRRRAPPKGRFAQNAREIRNARSAGIKLQKGPLLSMTRKTATRRAAAGVGAAAAVYAGYRGMKALRAKWRKRKRG